MEEDEEEEEKEAWRKEAWVYEHSVLKDPLKQQN